MYRGAAGTFCATTRADVALDADCLASGSFVSVSTNWCVRAPRVLSRALPATSMMINRH
jgi:hypothetical protein